MSMIRIMAAGWMLAVAVHAAGAGPGVSGGYDQALELLANGVVFEAVHALERHVLAHPDHREGRLLLAESLYRVQRPYRAVEELSHVLRIQPGHAGAWRLLTRIRAEIGRTLDRTDPKAVLDYARLCARPDSYDRAADHYRLALELDDDARIHLEFARMLHWAGRHEESAYHYERFLAVNASHAEALAELGRVYNSLGRFEAAASVIEASLSLRTADPDVQLDHARALIWAGREAEAEALLHGLRRRNTAGIRPLELLASLAGMQGRVLDEYEFHLQILQAAPGNEASARRKAVIEQGGELERARLEERIRRDPQDTGARRLLADLYIAEDRYGEAIPHLEELNRRAPEDIEALERLRHVREQEGRLVLERVAALRRAERAGRERRMDMLQQWVERHPGDARSLLLLTGLLDEAAEDTGGDPGREDGP